MKGSKTMNEYKLCLSESTLDKYEIIETTSRNQRKPIESEIKRNLSNYQPYADSKITGDISVYAIEYNAKGKPTGALYNHSEYGLIWLEIL